MVDKILNSIDNYFCKYHYFDLVKTLIVLGLIGLFVQLIYLELYSFFNNDLLGIFESIISTQINFNNFTLSGVEFKENWDWKNSDKNTLFSDFSHIYLILLFPLYYLLFKLITAAQSKAIIKKESLRNSGQQAKECGAITVIALGKGTKKAYKLILKVFSDYEKTGDDFKWVWICGSAVLVILLVLSVDNGKSSNRPSNSNTSSDTKRVNVSPELQDMAQALIISSGYSCNKIDHIMRKSWSGDFRVVCNGWSYTYNIID